MLKSRKETFTGVSLNSASFQTKAHIKKSIPHSPFLDPTINPHSPIMINAHGPGGHGVNLRGVECSGKMNKKRNRLL